MRDKINYKVFLPSALLFLGCIIYNFINGQSFAAVTTRLYQYILENFGWLFILVTFLVLILCIVIYFSKFGETVIGGKEAKPQLSKWSWFSITLCTTVAAGIVFWGAAEPVQHILNPPVSSGLEPMTSKTALFAMGMMYHHWTVLPYGLYTLLAVLFAFVYYNMRKPFSLGSMLSPLNLEKYHLNNVIDIICVFSLVAGLAGSLGVGVLNINGGLAKLWGIPSNVTVWLVIIVVIGTMAMISATTGINKGIKVLSNFNIFIYIGILVFILFTGGVVFILSFGMEGIGEFIQNFFSRAMFTGTIANDPWAKDWTMFYFAMWVAWAPITAVFLGRISYGRKVKEIVGMNLFITSLFSILWFMIVSGATINMLMNNPGAGLVEAFNAGYENVIYQVFINLPLAQISIPIYLIAIIISFVTAADSTTVAIAGLCSKGIAPDSPEAPKTIKLIWGGIIILLTWMMMSVGEGITGVKMLSCIGGLPAVIFIILAMIVVVKIMMNPNKYDEL